MVLCAAALESTRILLNSTSPRFPRGVGNSEGVLGHYLMDHFTVEGAGGFLPSLKSSEREPVGRPQVAIEVVDAGIGDFVFLVRAREASLATFPVVGPVDLAIVGVIDHADMIDQVELELPFGYSQFS